MRSRVPDATARKVLARYRFSRPAAIHTTVRWVTAPLREVERRLPAHGRLLEIGCGHGLFAAYAAARRPGLEVVGTDIDAEKIEIANRANAAMPRLTFDAVDARELPGGDWDAIAILDVLYLLDEAAQESLLKHAAGVIAPGGRLLVKEMAEQPRWKAQWNRFQETLSLRVLGITHGGEMTFVPTATVVGWLRESGLDVEVVALDRHRVHPHQLLVATRPGGATDGTQTEAGSGG